MVGRRAKLPNINHNIEVGNSLISDKKISDKAFDWEKSFPEVFRQGGFDVIIGNPPYISFYSRQAQTSSKTKDEIDYFKFKYNFIAEKKKLGRFNTIMFFIEKTIHLLKEGGLCGLIIDMNIFGNPYKDLRKYLLENSKILKIIVNLTDFEGVSSGQVVIIFQKSLNLEQNNKNDIIWMEGMNGDNKILINKVTGIILKIILNSKRLKKKE